MSRTEADAWLHALPSPFGDFAVTWDARFANAMRVSAPLC